MCQRTEGQRVADRAHLVYIASMTVIASALASSVGQRTHVEPTLFRGGLVFAALVLLYQTQWFGLSWRF